MPKIKLFFIPHAGGSALGYMTLKRFLEKDVIEAIPLEPAGRGKRINEPCFTDLRESAKDLCEKIKKQAGSSDYAIFGHSVGALLAYEVAKCIEKENMRKPRCLFLSGRCAPNYEFPYPMLTGLGEKAFIREFSKYQAMPEEVIKNEELKQMMLPIIRADIDMAEAYQYKPYPKLGTDFIVLCGGDDPMLDKQGIGAWEGLTKGSFYKYQFSGGHFYYTTMKREVGERITRMLKQYT